MKRAGHLIEQIAAPDNLRLAFWKAAKGKRHSNQVLLYAKNLDANLVRLRGQIVSGQVEVGNYRYFRVFEPKERQICSSAFGEQVLHHALMNICHPFFERAQIDDSYASWKGRGQYAAIDRARFFARQNGWFLKLDVRKFFERVSHRPLLAQLGRLFKDGHLLAIFSKILDSYQTSDGRACPPERRGLPIGNLTSQYFANHHLVALDRFVKEELCHPAYVRYMDDFILWHPEKEALKMAHAAIRKFVGNELALELKPELINRSALGLPFLGYRLFPHSIKLTEQSKRRFFKKMAFVQKAHDNNFWPEQTCQAHALPLLAFVQKADSHGLRHHFFYPENGQPP